MTSAIGDQVDGYVLTERGWVPQLELDTSPFRPGHVVNDAILTGSLRWQPLRTAPTAPYQVGDVVEGYVLVPSGDWVPLAGQVRDRSGARTAAPAEPTGGRAASTPARPQTSPAAQAQPAARPQAQPRTQAQPRAVQARAQAQPRPQAQPWAQTPPGPPRRVAQTRPQAPPPGTPAHVGQVVDGFVLTSDRGWVPVPRTQAPGRPAPRAATKTTNVTGQAVFGAVLVIVLLIVRSCA